MSEGNGSKLDCMINARSPKAIVVPRALDIGAIVTHFLKDEVVRIDGVMLNAKSSQVGRLQQLLVCRRQGVATIGSAEQ